MLEKIFLGAVSGYVLKIIQIGSNLFLIPFFISESVFGLAGYGNLVAVLALSAFMATLLDGWRLSTARRLGMAEKNGDRVYISLLGITVFPIVLLFIVAYYYGNTILSMVGMQDESGFLALYLIAFFLLEQMNYLSAQCFHAKRKTWIINLVTLFEVVCRTVTLYLLFKEEVASIELYLKVFIFYMAGKYVIFFCMLILQKNIISFNAIWKGVKKESDTFIYSLPLSLKGISLFSVFRLTVIVVNKYFSPELAAVYSILMVTLRGYVTQIFVSVLQPMIIPIFSGIDLQHLEKEKKVQLQSILNTYGFVVISICIGIACLVPEWLSLWLDRDMSAYHLLFILGISLFGLDASASVKNLLLVAQGHGKNLSKISIILASIYLVYLGSMIFLFKVISLEIIVIGVALFIFLYAGVFIPLMFSSLVLKEYYKKVIQLLFIYLLSVATAIEMTILLNYQGGSNIIMILSGGGFVMLYLNLIYNPFSDKYILELFKRILSR